MAQRMTRRGPLSRGEIVGRALDLAEAEGMVKLSLHKIADAVGVRTMSLYNHIRDKEDVLDAMADVILDGIVVPESDAMSWEDALRALARAFRAAVLQRPRSAPLVLTRRLNSPAALPVVESALTTLQRAGLPTPAAVHVLRSFIAFLIGTMSREIGTAPSYAEFVPEIVMSREQALTESEFPAVASAAAELAVCDHEAEMLFGLELLIDGVRGRVGQRG